MDEDDNERLGEKIDGLGEKIDGLTSALRGKASKKIVAFAVAALVVACVVGVVAWWRVSTTTNDIVKARADARVSACAHDVQFETAHNGLVDEDEQTFRQILNTAGVSAASMQFAQQRIDAYETHKVAVRICTPEAIAQYYALGGK